MPFWNEATARENTDKIFIFGDNAKGTGSGKYSGQAIIRYEPNAFGIPAKESPRRDRNAYWYDEDFDRNSRRAGGKGNKALIDEAIAKIPKGGDTHRGQKITSWVISSGGIGTNRAKTPSEFGTNEKTTEYIRQRLLSICTGD